jgi:hypothetical protein
LEETIRVNTQEREEREFFFPSFSLSPYYSLGHFYTLKEFCADSTKTGILEFIKLSVSKNILVYKFTNIDSYLIHIKISKRSYNSEWIKYLV